MTVYGYFQRTCKVSQLCPSEHYCEHDCDSKNCCLSCSSCLYFFIPVSFILSISDENVWLAIIVGLVWVHASVGLAGLGRWIWTHVQLWSIAMTAVAVADDKSVVFVRRYWDGVPLHRNMQRSHRGVTRLIYVISRSHAFDLHNRMEAELRRIRVDS